jgi:dTDP-4-amino-4,6-dideoxygalactose transaminase
MLAQGRVTDALEAAFARLCRTPHAVATSSGTTALHLALLANGVGPGDEVITTPFSFIASTNSILLCGATPVFVDVEPATGNIDATLVEAAITPRTRAILPVDLYGQMCDMDTIARIAEAHGLVVIEDACQAVGALLHGRPPGSWGTAVFSLYATKNIAAGEGGMIVTTDDDVADRCRLLRSHGMRVRYHHEMLGYNARISDLHAAVANAQLGRLEDLGARREQNAAVYNERITSVTTPAVLPGRKHVWHQYTVQVADGGRDGAVERLTAGGVGTGVFYPIPIHHQPHVREIVGDVSLPVAERLSRTVLSLPVHPELTAAERDTVVEAVNSL